MLYEYFYSFTSSDFKNLNPPRKLGDFWSLLGISNKWKMKKARKSSRVYILFIIFTCSSFTLLWCFSFQTQFKNISLKYAIYLPKIYRKIYNFSKKMIWTEGWWRYWSIVYIFKNNKYRCMRNLAMIYHNTS